MKGHICHFAIGVGIVAICAQITLTMGIEAGCDPSMAALIRTLDIPITLVMSYTLSVNVPGLWQCVGAALVTIGCIVPIVVKQHEQNKFKGSSRQCLLCFDQDGDAQ